MSEVNKLFLEDDVVVDYYLAGLDDFPKEDAACAFDITFSDVKYKNQFVRGILDRKLKIFSTNTKNNRCLIFVSNLSKTEWYGIIASIGKKMNLPVVVQTLEKK